jgi:chaperonin cofactor prefoldin
MSTNHDKKWADITFHHRQSDVVQPEETSNKGLWAAFAILLIALIGVATYGYVSLEKENIRLRQIPDVKESVRLVSERMAAAESRLREMTADWQSLEESLAKLDRKVNSRFGRTRKYAEQLTARVESRVQTRMDERAASLEARIRQLRSDREADRTRLAQLREELAHVQAEVAAVRHQTGQDVTGLTQRVAANERDIMGLNEDLEAARVDFEVVTKRLHELAPEISLKVTGTDVRYQRFSGWIRYAPEGRTFWVRNQGVQQPVTFYSKRGDEMYELVVTRVTKDSAVGYLLLPMGEGSEHSQPLVSRHDTVGL